MRLSLCALTLAAALAAPSCAQSIDSLGNFPCAKDGECPSPWSCVSGTCLRPDDPPPEPDGGTPADRKCETDTECDSTSVCAAFTRNGSGCVKTCTGFTNACGNGLDCKLALAVSLDRLVPICTSASSSTAGCSNVNDCAENYTCQYVAKVNTCTEQCNTYHSVCTTAGTKCATGKDNSGLSLPSGWGVCNKSAY